MLSKNVICLLSYRKITTFVTMSMLSRNTLYSTGRCPLKGELEAANDRFEVSVNSNRARQMAN